MLRFNLITEHVAMQKVAGSIQDEAIRFFSVVGIASVYGLDDGVPVAEGKGWVSENFFARKKHG
jgi:hypothetical protein